MSKLTFRNEGCKKTTAQGVGRKPLLSTWCCFPKDNLKEMNYCCPVYCL